MSRCSDKILLFQQNLSEKLEKYRLQHIKLLDEVRLTIISLSPKLKLMSSAPRFYTQHQGKKINLSNRPSSESAKIHQLQLAYERFEKTVDGLLSEAQIITENFIKKVDEEKYKRTLRDLKGIK